MKYLQKTWVRILASLLAGGFVAEIININSADPNHRSTPDNSSVYLLIVAPIAYLILTSIVKNSSGSNSLKK
jgi:hypothetical protein